MGPKAVLPSQLLTGPFTLQDARDAGLSWNQLRGPSWRRLGPAVYAWRGLPDTPDLHIAAVARRLRAGAAFAATTAAYLHGMRVDPCGPIQVILPDAAGLARDRSLRIWRGSLLPSELESRRGHPVTSLPRALRDIGLGTTPDELVALVDAALHDGLVTLDAIQEWLADHPHHRGTNRLRRAARLADESAESPMETRLRVLLVGARLGQPQSQVSLQDSAGAFVARADLYYPRSRLVIEYDGATHRDRLRDDNRRQNRLIGEGYTVLRFTADDVLNRPGHVVSQVRQAQRKHLRKAS